MYSVGELDAKTFSLKLSDVSFSLVFDFKFINETTSDIVEWTGNDISAHTERYSLFLYSGNIIESTYINFGNTQSGFYTYEIYEIDSTTLLTRGRMQLLRLEDTNSTDYSRYDGYDGEYKAYTI